MNVYVTLFGLIILQVVNVNSKKYVHHPASMKLATDPPHFEYALKCGFYVDKTMLLQSFLRSEKVFITCPNNFAKSTNLDMMKRFFGVFVNKTGYRHPKKMTANYRLFVNVENNLRITHDSNMMDKHMGEYGVVLLNFGNIHGENGGKIIECVIKQLRELVISYHWIYDMAQKNKSYGDLTILEKVYKGNITRQEATSGVKAVIGFLNSYYQNRTIVLIDNYDAPIEHAINRGLTSTDLHRLINSTTEIISETLRYANRSMVVGRSRLFGRFVATERNYFLDNHPYVEYFGFTEPQVHQLLAGVGPEEKETVAKCYGGYNVKNSAKSLYNPKAILRHFDTDDYESVEQPSETINKIMRCLRHQQFFLQMAKLVTKTGIELTETDFHVNDTGLMAFTTMMTDNCSKYDVSAPYMVPFVDKGYISCADDSNLYRLSNRMTEEIFKSPFPHFYRLKYKIFIINFNVGVLLRSILKTKHTTDEMLAELEKLFNEVFQPSEGLTDAFQFQSIIFGVIFWNIDTKKDVKLREVNQVRESQINGIDTLKLISDDEKTLLIIVVTFEKILSKAILEASQYVAFDPQGTYKFDTVKYLAINMNKEKRIEVGRGRNW